MAKRKTKRSRKTNKRLFVTYLFATIFYTLVVFAASLIPRVWSINIFSHNNLMYVLHFIEFFILAFLIFKTLYHKGLKNPYFSTYIIAILITLLSESTQLFISYRNFNPLDIAANALGAFIVLIILGVTR